MDKIYIVIIIYYNIQHNITQSISRNCINDTLQGIFVSLIYCFFNKEVTSILVSLYGLTRGLKSVTFIFIITLANVDRF